MILTMKLTALSKPALIKLLRTDPVLFISLPGSYRYYGANCDSTPEQPSHNRAFIYLPIRSYLPSCSWCKYSLRKLSFPIYLWSVRSFFFLSSDNAHLKLWFYGDCLCDTQQYKLNYSKSITDTITFASWDTYPNLQLSSVTFQQ